MTDDTSAARHTLVLLPCPFCGGAAEPSMGQRGDGSPWPYIECATCAASAEPDTWNRRVNTHDELLAALKALMPEGWGVDDTMDHMPGVKQARLAIARVEGRTP